MSTNAPAQIPQANPAPAPSAPSASPDVDKAVEQVLMSLSKLKKAAYGQSPDSPFVDSIHQVELAMLEIGSQMGAAPDAAPAPEMEMGPGPEAPQMEGPGAEPAPEAAMEYAGPQPESIDDAAQQTRDMMLQAAAARKAQGGR